MEEMHHITKAVDFTGNTIKRWLATSPQPPNADQTEEMAEPTTPVRSNKDGTLQFDEFDDHSNAPRKRTITIRLAPSRSGSVPSSSSDEPQTPTKSPKIIFQSSIDGTVFPDPSETTNALDADDVVDSDINDPVRISVHIVAGQIIYVHRAIISLNSSRTTLIEATTGCCANWRASQSEYMRWLKANGKCIYMLAAIQLGDRRDIYVGGNEQECYRFEILRDFFTDEELYFLKQTGERPTITVAVTMSAEDMPEDEGISEYPDPDLTNTVQWAYHRVASWPCAPESSVSQHIPLRTGLYGPYNRLKGHLLSNLIEVFERPFGNNLSIGNVSNPRRHETLPPPTSSEPQYRAENLLAGQTRPVMIRRNILFNTKWKRVEANVPLLPAMTFNELRRPAGYTKAISNEPIHLAVRFVNALPRQQNIHLPANVLMKVTPGKGTKAAIHTALTSSLYSFGKQFFLDSTGICKLFRGEPDEDGRKKGVWGGHRLDLWVLPQRGDHRMYNFERGSLKWYLDVERCKEGDRRLYVEAWILPGGEGEVSWEIVSDGEE